MTSRVALVTGGAQGIGGGISEALGAHGFRVAIADLNLDAAKETAKRITDAGGTAIAVAVDVTDTASVQAAIKTVTAELGEIEIAMKVLQDKTESEVHIVARGKGRVLTGHGAQGLGRGLDRALTGPWLGLDRARDGP